MSDLQNFSLSAEERKFKRDTSLTQNYIKVGVATCGIASGANYTLDSFKTETASQCVQVDILPTGCVGSCHAEPWVELRWNGENYYYHNLTQDQVPALVASLKDGKPTDKNLYATSGTLYQQPYFQKQIKLVSRNCGVINPESFADYLLFEGYQGLQKALTMTQEQVIAVVAESKLRGRGGAGFPTATKWSFMLKNEEKERYLVCNFDEGDPGAFMNRSLVEGDPFRLIEGMTIAAYAMGAQKGYIYGRAEYPLAIKRLQMAIETARATNLLGTNILGKGFDFDIEIKKGAGAFVCGEETALMQSIEGNRGMPRPRPPFPAQKGLWHKPTTINNVETLCHVATMFQFGTEDYKRLGNEKTGGTKMICLTGDILRTGVIEVPIAISLKDIIFEIAGGSPNGFKAVQLGGPSGGCVPMDVIDTPLDYEAINALGAIMGSGGMVVIDQTKDMVSLALFFLNFTKDESCGKCTPCREGTFRMAEIIEKIMDGNGKEEDITKLETLANVIIDSAACGLGQTAPKPVLSTLRYFRHEWEEYISGVRNRNKQPTFTINDKCIGCTKCARVCPVPCIAGKVKELHVIDQAACIHCGSCFQVCPVKAITKS